jgi:hypothetical protein
MGFTAGMPRTKRPPPEVVNTWMTRFTHRQWFSLPKELRFRWWQETFYSELEPSPELVEAVKAALAAKEAHG